MADRHVAAVRGPSAGSPFALVIDMDNGAVLDVGAGADLDAVAVAAQHAAIPDAGTGTDLDIADDDRGLGDEGIGRDLRGNAFEGFDQGWHGLLIQVA